ncbi:hypothetical protein AAHK20_14240 [Trinickia sp. YCB016]
MTHSERTNVKDITSLPSFHDAELIGIEHRPDDYTLTLHFRRVNGEIGSLSFTGVMAQRIVDFAEQNVVSRLLISPLYRFSPTETRSWLQWVSSRDDATATAIDDKAALGHAQGFGKGLEALFVLEPSCGAEVAVHCKDIWIHRQATNELNNDDPSSKE